MMKLTSAEFLSGVDARSTCPGCNCSRKYFCYDCRLLMPAVSSFAPKEVQLPAAVDIVKHTSEKNSKCTGVHCVLTAPSFVRLYDFPEFPDYRQDTNRKTVLIYPDKKAISIAEYVEQFSEIDRFVFLDCTWSQAAGMRRDERLSGLPVIRLNSYRTQYWRPQHGHTEEDLATVEAVYYAMREYRDVVKTDSQYGGDFDDLLFWFDYFHRFVNDGRGLRALIKE